MEIDGTYDQNRKKLLTFSYGKEPNNISIKSKYDGCRLAVKDSPFNRFKSSQ